MSDLLAAAAEALGVPEAIVSRSAEARATATGATVEEILTAWAEGGDITAEAPPAKPALEEETEEKDEAPDQPTPEDEPTTEIPQPSEPAEEKPAPPPTRPTQVAAPSVRDDAVVTVATAGIRERTAFTVPRWLVALFFLIPTFGLLHLAGATAGECGSATRLLADRLTGNVVDCDGSTYEGGGTGGGTTDFVALGDRIYNGTGVTGVNCAGCHGAGGAGSEAFPALTGVGTTFGACADHMEWVMLGSQGFLTAGRSTYGDTGKPIRGGMPPHPTLTEEQLAAVAAFERVRFGGADRDQVLTDCGLIQPADDEAPAGEEEETEEPPTTSG